MIELKRDAMVFSFPEVHPEAQFRIDFQRTLRLPDDGNDYPLPAGLGRFPLRHVDDFAEQVPETWLARGGVMLPMYQSEAMWLNISSPSRYPFAVKVAAGKVNAVTGAPWENGLTRTPQDYLTLPEQSWLDGFCVEEGVVRQFVAMPLGNGYTAEEQLTGKAEHGGIQIIAYPMRREAWERMRRPSYPDHSLAKASVNYSASDMGMAPGGRMRQEVYDDPHDFGDWSTQHRSRCFVHLANTLVWRHITGQSPPTTPPTAKEYASEGLPWFELYAQDQEALQGGKFPRMKSVAELAKEKGQNPLPENESVTPGDVIALRNGLGKHEVRDGRF